MNILFFFSFCEKFLFLFLMPGKHRNFAVFTLANMYHRQIVQLFSGWPKRSCLLYRGRLWFLSLSLVSCVGLWSMKYGEGLYSVFGAYTLLVELSMATRNKADIRQTQNAKRQRLISTYVRTYVYECINERT